MPKTNHRAEFIAIYDRLLIGCRHVLKQLLLDESGSTIVGSRQTETPNDCGREQCRQDPNGAVTD